MSVIVLMGDSIAESPEIGNKVKSLAALAGLSIRIPRGFGLTYAVYERHVKTLLPRFDEIVSEGGSYKTIASLIQQEIVSRSLEDESEIMRALGTHIQGADFFAIRSSGSPVIRGIVTAEDSKETSLAGQYESFLMVPRHRVSEAVRHCFASLFNERCLAQFAVKEDRSYFRSRMSILIQEMYVADLCGVVMTRDPIEDSDSIFGIEIAYGACEAIVSGRVQGDIHLCDRGTGSLISSELGSKKWCISHQQLEDFALPNRIEIEVADPDRLRYAASEELIQRIFHIAMDIERHFGLPQDIELIVANDDIIITQARPITYL